MARSALWTGKGLLASTTQQERETVVFLPAWNEAESVGVVVQDVAREFPASTIVVIDDGSADATRQNAHRAGARVATLPFNSGLGAALQTGYMFARDEGFKYFAHLDADGQHPPGELARILGPVWEGKADLTVGTRFITQPGRPEGFRSSPIRRAGIWLLGGLLSGSSGQKFTDITSGFRAGNRKTIELFADLYQPDFGEIESLQRSLARGLAVVEVPVLMRAREHGTSLITPLSSVFFVFKALITIGLGRFRSATE